jgi:1,4-dihydroxy-2-naphthoyl-CoA hydrolase
MGEPNAIQPPPGIREQYSALGLDLSAPGGVLGRTLGIEIIEAGPERVVGSMPVEGNTQPYGLLHGGASAALAETLGSVAAGLHAAPTRIALGVDLNVTHHRGIRSGTVTGVAVPVHQGRSSATYEIAITDGHGRRVCSARLTCALRPAPGNLGADTG